MDIRFVDNVETCRTFSRSEFTWISSWLVVFIMFPSIVKNFLLLGHGKYVEKNSRNDE